MVLRVNVQWIAVALGLLAGLLSRDAAAQASNPNVLWQIVHGQCVPDQQQHGDPKPCAEVDLAGGFAVLKDISGASQFLLIPTAEVGGIEAPSLLAPLARNYFAEAWQARGLVEKALGHPMPRDMLSLAINSASGRTQDQFHIHIDCIRADIRDALLRERPNIGWRWSLLKTPLAGHQYRAMRVMGPTLFGRNPFKLLAWGVPGARADMGQHTLVVVGMVFGGRVPGFVILDDHADKAHGDWASGEELQDHGCALAR
ncbi:MAG TPA: CDP-diacylglycerol diphosphatase [Xanthobacteraceae bacterium]|nr:CDP-diacylglycerol diphosphatase [Xanthobacteraceae bacterium]